MADTLRATTDRPGAPTIHETRRWGRFVAVAAAAALVPLLAGAPLWAAPVAAIGAVVAAQSLRGPEVALLGLIAVGMLESSIPPVTGEFFTPVKLAGAFAFGAFAINAVFTRRRLSLDAVHITLGLLLVVALISSLQAQSVPDGLSTSLRYASFAGLYAIATQPGTPRRLPVHIVWVLTGACALAAALAMRNFLAGTTDLAAPLYGDANDLAFLIATTLPLTAWLLRAHAVSRPVVVVVIAVMATAILLSLSRGALLGLAAGVVWHAVTHRRHVPAMLLATAVALGAAFAVVGANEERVERSLTLKRNIAAYNVETRLDAWRAAAQLMADKPLLGVGPGNFGFHYFEQTGRPPGTFGLRVVHDAYLDVGAELGLTGLVLFCVFLVATFMRATTGVRERRGPPELAAAVRTSMVVAAVAALTLSEQYFPPFWVLGALGTLLAGAPRADDDAPVLA